jgi:geranylgeranyl reductase
VPGAEDIDCVFAYHEIVRAPSQPGPDYDASRCDVYYRGTISPDFYGWVFPHGKTMSIGTGSADKGFSLRNATSELRAAAGLAQTETLRREGAPLPMKPLK